MHQLFLTVIGELFRIHPVIFLFQYKSGLFFDDAPSHFSLAARECLNHNFPNQWIGIAGPQPWPPRSSDLNPLDYFF